MALTTAYVQPLNCHRSAARGTPTAQEELIRGPGEFRNIGGDQAKSKA
jgi:hypothetical protein